MKVGDRVIVNGEYDGLEFNNSKGVIIDETERISKEEDIVFLIEFDEFIAGHGSSHGGKPGHCWYIPEDMIKKENTMKERIEELEKELAALKAQLGKKYEPKSGRYTIGPDGNVYEVCWDAIIKERTKTGNAFDTKEKAEKARDIMVKHDIILKYVIDHAPDYMPNDKDCASVYFLPDLNEWSSVIASAEEELIGTILMPVSVAKKLADDLNNNRIEGM